MGNLSLEKTEKAYFDDSYLCTLTSKVVKVEKKEGCKEVVVYLDKTIFHP
jgi:Ser-tRNA(Ala) deacylase AlaX